MSNAIRVVVLAVIVTITAVCLSLGFYVYKMANAGMLDYDSVLNKIFNNSSGPSFAQYDGRTVDGEYVRTCIEKFGGEYFIRVRTSQNPMTFSVMLPAVNGYVFWEDELSSATVYSITDTNSMCYVPAEELFDCTVLRDGQELYGVYFEQSDIGVESSTKTDKLYSGASISAKRKAKASKVKAQKSAANKSATLWANALKESQATITSLENEISKNETDSTIKVKNSRAALNSFNAYYDQYVSNKNAVDAALDVMQKNVEDQYEQWGVSVLGRAELDPNATEDTNPSGTLQYWRSIYNDYFK